MYDDAARAIRDNTFPKLKAYVVWDNYTSSSHDDRVGYTQGHVLDPVEQQHYNDFANDPALVGTAVPEPTDQVPPTVVRLTPDDGATVDGDGRRHRHGLRRRGARVRPAPRRRQPRRHRDAGR